MGIIQVALKKWAKIIQLVFDHKWERLGEEVQHDDGINRRVLRDRLPHALRHRPVQFLDPVVNSPQSVKTRIDGGTPASRSMMSRISKDSFALANDLTEII